MSDTEESAKAIQELSKLGRELIKSLKPLERIATQILGPFGQGYGILTDIVHYKREEIRWRFENRKAVYELALQRLEERNIDLDRLKRIPHRVAFEYEKGLEHEDDIFLQQLWANLLINVSDPKTGILPRKVFRDILGKLDPEQALFLNELGLQSSSIKFYFVVCDATLEDGTGGSELAFAPVETRQNKITSSALFQWFSDGESFFVPWPADKVEATVDILHATGLVHWRKELHFAKELFETDLRRSGAETPAEIGRIVLANASGIHTFALSQLGEEFVRAVSPTPPIKSG